MRTNMESIMTIRFRLAVLTAVFLTCPGAVARADFVEYDLGELGKFMTTIAGAQNKAVDFSGDTKITLPGKAVVQSGGLLSYTHPNGPTLHFRLEEVKHIKAPTAREEFNKMMARA